MSPIKKSPVTPRTVHGILGRHILADGYPMVVDTVKSRGSYMYDARSRRYYLDFFSFFASMPLGYNHPRMLKGKFVKDLFFAAVHKPSNSDFYTVAYAEFVQTMAEVAMPRWGRKMFFIDGGALAVENALKTAFDWKIRKNFAKGAKKEIGTKVLHFRQSFHGRSGYTLSLTNTADPRKTMYFPKFDWPRFDNPKLSFPVTPAVLKDVMEREAKVVKEIEAVCRKEGDDIAALIIEPIQAEGGDNHFRAEFLKELRRLADRYDFLLIFDEIQTGCGITGRMWAHEHFGVAPDILCFGKKFQTCGIIVGDRVFSVPKNVFEEESRINSTWGGNLVDMVRSSQYLKIIRDEDLVGNAARMGKVLQKGLADLAKCHEKVSNVRGRGLFCAFDFANHEKRNEFLKRCQEKEHLILLPCGERSVRFRPFLDVDEKAISDGMERIDRVLRTM